MNATVQEVPSIGLVLGAGGQPSQFGHENKTYVVEIDCGGFLGESFEDQIDSFVAVQRRGEESIPFDQVLSGLGSK